MKTLIIGASSLIGKHLYQSAPCDVICTYHLYCPCPAAFLDTTNVDSIQNVFRVYKPDVVICCAAEGDVDVVENEYEKVKTARKTLNKEAYKSKNPVLAISESHSEIVKEIKAYKVNVEGVRKVVAACREYSAKFVHISTNAVFYGDKAPYSEKDERKAINKYGEIKILAENEAIQSKDWLVIRPILLYGNPWINGRTNFVTRTVEKLKAGEKIKVVNDTVTQPTYVGDLAKAIWKLIENDAIQDKEKGHMRRKHHWNDIIHMASPEKTSLYNFALKIASIYDLDERLIEPVSSDYFKGIAPRPVDTTYNLNKMDGLGITCQGICEGLECMKEEK